MNTVERLNAVIDYIETHMTGNIDMNALASIACCSVYDLQRMFMFIADISVSDYIRKRRLTLAGIELKYRRESVIDTALKYGYESPVSFARAFRAFHGTIPSKAKNTRVTLITFPRLIFQINVKEVSQMVRKDRLTVNGKEYEASYFGELDMSSWSYCYSKREYWRLENVGDDFKDIYPTDSVLPYNNYPPISFEEGQVFVIDYHSKENGAVERKYYIADGTVWNDLPSTREFLFAPMPPSGTEMITLGGKEYEASCFGEYDISSWSVKYTKREFRRIENAYDDFKDSPRTDDVLPFNNYPPIKVEVGQVFVIDYTLKSDGSVERHYYIADGTVWNDLPSTAEFTLN